MRKVMILAAISLFTVLVISSCAPQSGVSETKFGPDDPSNRIVIEEDLTKRGMIDGYRVKVASVDTENEALMIEKQVVEAVQEPVYIEFIVDKYMVYVGDCQNKEEANILRDKIAALGFEKTYSVPKKVYKKDITETPAVTETAGPDITPETAPPVPDRFNQVIGYRVQIFAARDKNNAEKVKNLAMNDTKERVYVVLADDNLYKVQVGDYLSRIDAEKMRDKLRALPNYQDAFIQNTYVFYDTQTSDGSYYIQVGAFSTSLSAEEFIKTSLNTRGYENTSVQFDNNLYKVLVGGYGSNEEAATVKSKLQENGFEGTWIIKK
ncbi:MAG: SPOR domain-containing protein [Candidatus Delongbacteria bacterium]|nr:SPOR domain-containing protein [Candidatus Delongbacteria bacterium]